MQADVTFLAAGWIMRASERRCFPHLTPAQRHCQLSTFAAALRPAHWYAVTSAFACSVKAVSPSLCSPRTAPSALLRRLNLGSRYALSCPWNYETVEMWADKGKVMAVLRSPPCSDQSASGQALAQNPPCRPISFLFLPTTSFSPVTHPLPSPPQCKSISFVLQQVRRVRCRPLQWLNAPSAITTALVATAFTVNGKSCRTYDKDTTALKMFSMHDYQRNFSLFDAYRYLGGATFYATPTSDQQSTTMKLSIENDLSINQYIFKVKGYNLSTKDTSYVNFQVKSNHKCNTTSIQNFVNVTGVTVGIKPKDDE